VGAWGDHACASIPLLNVPDWSRQRARLEAALEGSAKLDEGAAMVSVVGDGLTASAASLPRFLDAVGAGLLGRVVAGPLRMSALVPSEQLESVQRPLHAAFVS
jgi:aspartokinase